jgi:hypothetical protein
MSKNQRGVIKSWALECLRRCGLKIVRTEALCGGLDFGRRKNFGGIALLGFQTSKVGISAISERVTGQTVGIVSRMWSDTYYGQISACQI